MSLLAGYDSLETVVILGNQTTVDKLKKGDSKFGVDIDLIVGRDSALAQTDSNWTEAETAVRPLDRLHLVTMHSLPTVLRHCLQAGNIA